MLRSEFAFGKKGGTLAVEARPAPHNIIFQTRGAPPSEFERKLADDLAAVFGQGHSELDAVVEALNARGSVDGDAHAWTVETFTAQLRKSGDALFAIVENENA